MKDKQQQLANILEDKQKNVEILREQHELKDLSLEELLRRKQDVIAENLVY
jgi:hypothetical protein